MVQLVMKANNQLQKLAQDIHTGIYRKSLTTFLKVFEEGALEKRVKLRCSQIVLLEGLQNDNKFTGILWTQ